MGVVQLGSETKQTSLGQKLLLLESCRLRISKSSPALLRHDDSCLGAGLVYADLLVGEHSFLLGGNLETARH